MIRTFFDIDATMIPSSKPVIAVCAVRTGCGKSQTAIVREISWDTFGDYVQHIDMMPVELKDEIQIAVPLHFTGVPIGISEGGVLGREQRLEEQLAGDCEGQHGTRAAHTQRL